MIWKIYQGQGRASSDPEPTPRFGNRSQSCACHLLMALVKLDCRAEYLQDGNECGIALACQGSEVRAQRAVVPACTFGSGRALRWGTVALCEKTGPTCERFGLPYDFFPFFLVSLDIGQQMRASIAGKSSLSGLPTVTIVELVMRVSQRLE